MDLPVNKFKGALLEGRHQLGLWCSLPGSFAAELSATAEFDWLLFDTEHSPNDPIDVLPQLQAVAAYSVSSVVRPASNDPVLIKRFLDGGAQTLLIPFVQTASDAAAAVASTRYPPEGMRGVSGMTRATRFGQIRDYARRAAQEICVLAQVETAEAIDAIESIADVDGIDGIFIGPADLAASLGHLGQPGHPDVVNVIESAIFRIRNCNKPAGILTPDIKFAKRCIELGTMFTAVGSDLGLLANAARALRRTFQADELRDSTN